MKKNYQLDFQKIRRKTQIKDINSFNIYLKNIFSDLSRRDQSQKIKGIDKIAFIKYMNIPFIVGEKLFKVLDTNKNGTLENDEFIKGITNLYVGRLEDTQKIIFNLLDFDSDGVIIPEDSRLLIIFIKNLANVPKGVVKQNVGKTNTLTDEENLQEINKLVKNFFNNKKKMNFEEYKNNIENFNSDVFFIFICFFYNNRPFTENSIKILRLLEKNSHNFSSANSISSQVSEDDLSINNSKSRIRRPSKIFNSFMSDMVSNLDLDEIDRECVDDQLNNNSEKVQENDKENKEKKYMILVEGSSKEVDKNFNFTEAIEKKDRKENEIKENIENLEEEDYALNTEENLDFIETKSIPEISAKKLYNLKDKDDFLIFSKKNKMIVGDEVIKKTYNNFIKREAEENLNNSRDKLEKEGGSSIREIKLLIDNKKSQINKDYVSNLSNFSNHNGNLDMFDKIDKFDSFMNKKSLNQNNTNTTKSINSNDKKPLNMKIFKSDKLQELFDNSSINKNHDMENSANDFKNNICKNNINKDSKIDNNQIIMDSHSEKNIKKNSRISKDQIPKISPCPSIKSNSNQSINDFNINNNHLPNKSASYNSEELNFNNLTNPKYYDSGRKIFQQNDESPREEEVIIKDIIYENYIFKSRKNNKLKKYYIVLIGLDLFYFSNSNKKKLRGMHNLSGSYISEDDNVIKVHEDTTNKKEPKTVLYHPFKLYFKKKARIYYCPCEKETKTWIKYIQNITSYRDINNYYNFGKVLGSGKFGKVKIGNSKSSKNIYAIKTISKEVLKPKELEMIKTEIEILKFCRHKNIVKLIENYEDLDNIYLVLEYLKGGNLNYFLCKQENLLSEERIKELVLQIGNVISYLHNFGIIHRDLKPENCVMTEIGNNAKVKIIDFGLSKILGVNENSKEAYGTLSYAAPEIISKTDYNNKIDIWSIGIILYFLICGYLPFSDKNNNYSKIAKDITKGNIIYEEKIWSKISKEGMDIVKKCLERDISKRLDIKEFLNHPWFLSVEKKKRK